MKVEDKGLYGSIAPPTLFFDTMTRLTPAISLFEFHIPENITICESYRPGQYITLQFPADLDPIGGSRTLRESDRRISFTPCRVWCENRSTKISILARNGRVTDLIGLPRPHGSLTCVLIEVSGGFSDQAFLAEAFCVAGGTGIACFATMDSRETRSGTLVHSIGAEDFDLVPALLDAKLLRTDAWLEIQVFITPGINRFNGKESDWWQNRLASLQPPPNIHFQLGRMSDLDFQHLWVGAKTLLFCGSRSLEWQIKMWTLGNATVHTAR